ncbi:uncharacterized protein N7459_004080 [Penicillium hispanicum]|uniref:uncharacterized protein n=1 Tax=Penicillium hispanicum TaxID=1080232 RepID=UPI002541323C|nr:uncharacterized protein N7459_004080 [Penicillium hispanicum]KAJ5584280.1 hypothetical protein N7459_004080 [Penicillium hispanicum]
MKLNLSLVAFASVALAQGADIGLPTKGQTVPAGQDVIVQVQRVDTLTNSNELAVAIGISSCAKGCLSAMKDMGTLLFNGTFEPAFHEAGPPPYQNYSVTIPSDFTKGAAQINVAHATLVGALLYPMIEGLNQSIIVT